MYTLVVKGLRVVGKHKYWLKQEIIEALGSYFLLRKQSISANKQCNSDEVIRIHSVIQLQGMLLSKHAFLMEIINLAAEVTGQVVFIAFLISD